jgi:hypothetical protein
MFTVITIKSKMDQLEHAIEERKTFLENAEKNGGDIHYFKKQTFHSGHKRMVNNRIIIILY